MALTLEGIQSVLPPTHRPPTSAHKHGVESPVPYTPTLPLWGEE